MDSAEILDLIDKIAVTSSKNDKEELIRAHSEDAEFIAVLNAGLNTFITYGMNQVPERSPGVLGGFFRKATWDLLDDLSHRRLTGNSAKEAVRWELNELGPKSADLLTRIIKKDLRAGFSESTVNKAIPGTIPTFDCMLAHKFEEKRIKSWPQYVEPKLDGVRVLCFADAMTGDCRFFSRSGKEFTTFDHIKDSALLLANQYAAKSIVFDGEVVSGQFNKTVGDVRRKSEQATDAVLYVFDAIPPEAFKDESKSGYKLGGNYLFRRQLLQAIFTARQDDFPIRLNHRYIVNSFAEIYTIYENVRAQGLEGLIVKDPDGLYHRRRNHGWMKIKAEESVDITVTGYEEGTGKAADSLGAFICSFNGVFVNVGSGLSDEQRKLFWEAKSELPGRIIEVEYHEVTPDGSLRHPRFVRFRDTLEHGVKE